MRGISFFKKAEIASVSLAIESELNSAQEDLNKQASGLVPFPAKVEWLDDQDPESFCDTYNGQVVIRMKEHKYNARNISWATLDYISKGLIPYSRPYLDSALSRSIDYTMVRKVLSGNEGALDYFYREVVVPNMNDNQTRDTMKILENIDKKGILTRIYLQEIKELGLNLYPDSDNVAIIETREFAESLNQYALRAPSQKMGDPYIRNRIKVGMVLIADTYKLESQGADPYLLWVGTCIANGAENIYLLSRKEKNEAALVLANWITSQFNLEIKGIETYDEIIDDKKAKALCIRISRKLKNK